MLRNTVLEARDIWKGNGRQSWVLHGIRLEIMEGDFIAILGGPAAGKTTLLKVLSFRDAPDQGAVYFEGRLVGRTGARELEQMCSERVWFIDGGLHKEKIQPNGRLAAVLLDEPEREHELPKQIRDLNRAGVAVVLATRNPEVASLAPLIYKLNDGKLEKLTDGEKME
ncbi:ATP-binding cassette domain-containing protein [Dethiobacter alkaliphilus]|uniref:ATP-binding cassette domain-containing protein n=1 Tax=Dethiobacter alkaliphilus TaxID=427926 RepID=UPI002225E148|nr:ATP-binding cassette domain-containing protein [Dethiobacter alkaliphilus]MCW3490958.1 ATP-binding cassette domain-containing protein [Dethiobacter alkaliphilus]